MMLESYDFHAISQECVCYGNTFPLDKQVDMSSSDRFLAAMGRDMTG
jgi:hypothetical protein